MKETASQYRSWASGLACPTCSSVVRRINLFAQWLVKMHRRRRDSGDLNCFVIFGEDDPKQADYTPRRSRASSLVCTAVGSGAVTGETGAEDEVPPDGNDDQPNKNGRFVQFCFEPEFFWLELPNTTLSREEAERIFRDRTGFFWLKDNPLHATRLCKRFDPLTKFYLYGDEMRAAEDIAYVLFQVWHFPATWRFFVKAACFDGPDFEQGEPID
jgi:hypothetical protein